MSSSTPNENPMELVKQLKREILSTAWSQEPPDERVRNDEVMDKFIHHYLTLKFNPGAYTWLKASAADALFVIQTSAEASKEGAQISMAKTKAILDRPAGWSPTTGPRG